MKFTLIVDVMPTMLHAFAVFLKVLTHKRSILLKCVIRVDRIACDEAVCARSDQFDPSQPTNNIHIQFNSSINI